MINTHIERESSSAVSLQTQNHTECIRRDVQHINIPAFHHEDHMKTFTGFYKHQPHKHTHTHTRAHTHTHTLTHTRALTNTRIYTRARTLAHTHARTITQKYNKYVVCRYELRMHTFNLLVYVLNTTLRKLLVYRLYTENWKLYLSVYTYTYVVAIQIQKN